MTLRRLLSWRPELPGPWLYVLNKYGIPLVPIEAGYRIALPFADLFHYTRPRTRETTRRNFARVLGRPPDDPAVRRMAHACFHHFARYVAEFGHVQGWDTEMLLDRLDVEGEEHFAQAESRGKGVIFVSAHMGSTEIAAKLAVLYGFKVTAVSERIRPQTFMDWAIASRADAGITLLPIQGAGLRLLRALRRREMVAMIIDAGLHIPDTLPVSFFGRRTVFPAGPARLARLSGAPIVFALAARRPGGRFRAHVCPPLYSERELSPEDDARRLTEQLAAIFEGFVRRYPPQWYAFREMWPQDAGGEK